MKTIIILFVMFASSGHAGDLSATQACLQKGYAALTNRRAIAVAVLDSESAQTMMFGTAFYNQLFEIGSVTKTFTANLLAQAVAAGKIKIDDPIPAAYQKDGSTITYRHLTTHTSGINGGLFGYKAANPLTPFAGLTVAVFKKLYAETPLDFSPGAKWQYSNFGESLLGLVLSETAGQSYEDMVRTQIFRPLKMYQSYFQIPAEKMDRYRFGHLVDPTGQMMSVPHWDLYNTAIDPAGGIRATIGDMIKYARAQLTPEQTALSASLTLAQQPLAPMPDTRVGKAKIAMNWIVQPDANMFWHNGMTYGFNSIVAISKQKNQAVVALSDTTVQIKDASGNATFDSQSLQNVAFDCLTQ